MYLSVFVRRGGGLHGRTPSNIPELHWNNNSSWKSIKRELNLFGECSSYLK